MKSKNRMYKDLVRIKISLLLFFLISSLKLSAQEDNIKLEKKHIYLAGIQTLFKNYSVIIFDSTYNRYLQDAKKGTLLSVSRIDNPTYKETPELVKFDEEVTQQARHYLSILRFCKKDFSICITCTCK